MFEPLSLISLDDLHRLNGLAGSNSAASQLKLRRSVCELARAGGSEALCGSTRRLALVGPAMAAIGSVQELEAVLDGSAPVAATSHPVEQVAACIALLRGGLLESAPEGEPAYTPRYSRGQLQQRLSRLLLDFPVLMDPWLVLPVRMTGEEHDWLTIPAAIAESSFAGLPSRLDGVSEAELTAFACHPCVRLGLTMRCARSLHRRHHAFEHHHPVDVAIRRGGFQAGDRVMEPATSRATRGRFIVSLMVLDDLSVKATGHRLIESRSTGFRAHLFRQLAVIAWDLLFEAGSNSPGLDEACFVEALRLPLPLADHHEDGATYATAGMEEFDGVPSAVGLRMRLAMTIDRALFGAGGQDWAGAKPGRVDAGVVAERTRRSIRFLVATGSCVSEREAAALLSSITVGHRRSHRNTAGPLCTLDCATAFVGVLQAYGVGPTVHNDWAVMEAGGIGALGVGRQFNAARAQSLDTWRTAIAASRRSEAAGSLGFL